MRCIPVRDLRPMFYRPVNSELGSRIPVFCWVMELLWIYVQVSLHYLLLSINYRKHSKTVFPWKNILLKENLQIGMF